MSLTISEQVEQCLDTIRPAIAMHKGSVVLLGIDEIEGIVRVKLEGACKGCPMSQITLKMGIEAEIISKIPSIKQVIAVSEADEKCCEDGEGECCTNKVVDVSDTNNDEDEWFYQLLGENERGL